jgi:dihydroorotase
VEKKQAACGCAGIFNAPLALEAYAGVFEAEGALDRLEGFASEHGPRFYGLPLNEGRVTLVREKTAVPSSIDSHGIELSPFLAGQTIGWRLEDA